MKAVEIFDVCHGRYRGLREWLDDSAGAVRSVDLGKPSEGYHWRPGRARANMSPILSASGATRCAARSGRVV